MSGESVEITMLGTDKGVLQAMTSVEKALERIADKMSASERSSAKAAKVTEEGFKSAGTAIENVVTETVKAYTGMRLLEKAAEAAAKAIEDVNRRQKEAATAQIDYAAKLKQSVADAGGFMKGPEIDRMVRKTALAADADQGKTSAALDAAMVAGDVHDKKGAEKASKVALAVLRKHKDESAEDIGATTAAAARLMDRPGAKNMAPEAAVGMLERIGQAAGLKGPESLSKHVVPKMAIGQAAGMTIGESGALYSTLARGLADPTGKLSDTAFEETVDAVKERFPDQDPAAVIHKMQMDPKLRSRFLHGEFRTKEGKKLEAPTFSGKVRPTIEALLKGKDKSGKETDEAARFKKLEGTLGDPNAGQTYYDESLANLKRVGVIRLKERDEAFDSHINEMKLQSEEGANKSIHREKLEKALSASGMGYFQRTARAAEFSARTALGEHPNKVTEDILSKHADDLDHPFDYPTGGPGGAAQRVPHVSTKEEREHAESLRGLVRNLRDKDQEDAEAESEQRADEEKERPQPRREQAPAPKEKPRRMIISREDFRRVANASGLKPDSSLEHGLFDATGMAYDDQIRGAANDEAIRLKTVRERHDERGNYIRTDPVKPNDPMDPQQAKAVAALEKIGDKLDILISQGKDPAPQKVVNVGSRPQYSTQSIASPALSNR